MSQKTGFLAKKERFLPEVICFFANRWYFNTMLCGKIYLNEV